MPTDKTRIHDLLRRIPVQGLDAVKRLFCTELNYHYKDSSLSTRKWPQQATDALHGSPRLLAEQGDFAIIHSRLTSAQRGRDFPLSIVAERQVIEQLLDNHPYALFLFSDVDDRCWHLVNVRYDRDAARRRVFRRIAVGPHERLRTAAERVALLDPSDLGPDPAPLAVQQLHDEAFNVERVTQKFFADYRRIFEASEAQIGGLAGEELRLFTQLLFNRLLFITFLERKGWLTFAGRDDYLRALWEDHQSTAAGDPEANFYRDRLTLLFFSGLNNPQSVDLKQIRSDGFLQGRIGQVPYLNGGLFEKEALDAREGVTAPDALFAPILDELIYHYNFTVTESTPLDVEVAVDPEMLGKIFEELVTGRHESGSYYTPKTVVAFMCREALEGYLRDACPRESPEAIGALVEQRDAAGLRGPEALLDALQTVRVCDPACGSGAYLVGMLHELVDLRQALFVSRGVDARAVYDKKLEIIQRSLYGVDIDPFAVNIARLRLWLSLIVDFDGDVPPPLPNLEFKIEVGDSLTGPAPGQLQPDLFHHQQVEEYFRLKGQFMTAHGPDKVDLRRRIEQLRAAIAAWASAGGGEGFDWAVTFAEVFAGPGWAAQTLTGALSALVNVAPGQMELTARQGRPPGFDVVVANPPYVRQELLAPALKETLKKHYPEVYTGTADLYVYFYARALHLLRPGGAGSFISSNKWLRAGYGKKLRAHLAERAAVDAVIDFGDLPLFEATAYPMIIVFRNAAPGAEHALRALEVEDLAVVERLPEAVAQDGWTQPQRSLRADGWTLVLPDVRLLLSKLRRSGTPLGEYVEGRFYRGITTGLNEGFVIEEATRQRLIEQDPRSVEVIKPWLRGRDVKRWKTEWAGQHLAWAYQGIEIDKYLAILEHLAQYRERLTERWELSRGQCKWYELRPCDYYAEFEKPKIIWAKYGIEPAFGYDTLGRFCSNTVFILPTDQLVLVGILNSKVIQWFAGHTFNIVRGGYIEWIPTNVGKLPIPPITPAQRAAIESLVRKLLGAHQAPGAPQVPGTFQVPGTSEAGVSEASQIAEWERELNALVYQVYGLTGEEIAIIEEACPSPRG